MFDNRSYIKEQIFNNSFKDNDKCKKYHFEKNRPCPYQPYGISDKYITVDSLSKREESNINNGEFIFDLGIELYSNKDGLPVYSTISNISEIVVSEFCVNNLPNDNFTDIDLSEKYPTLNLSQNGVTENSKLTFCNKLYLYIKEFGNEAYHINGEKKKKYHISFNAEYTANGILFKPSKDFNNFIFTEQKPQLTTLTLNFHNSMDNICFFPDIIYDINIFTDALGDIYIEYNKNANIAIGDRIYLQNFEFDSNSSEGIIFNKYINRIEGHLIGTNGFVANTQFKLNPNINTFLVPPNTKIQSKKKARLIIAKNRILLDIKLRTIIDRLTNYYAP